MASFVQIPTDTLTSYLEGMKFVPETVEGELVYARPCKLDERLKMVVYTSIKAGSDTVRGAGQDAVRVALTYDGRARRRGVKSNGRVNRVGTVDGVLARLKKRVIETALWTADNLRRCPCGGLRYAGGRCLEEGCR